MDNKLSELSKPVAWKFKNADGGDRVSLERKANIYGRHDFQPLYSQEYVSALIQRAERLDSMLTESVQALKVAEKLNADAEVRGVEKLAAAFKSWASDETFPDYEAQRHWATASQEALSFSGDLRNGSCDDR